MPHSRKSLDLVQPDRPKGMWVTALLMGLLILGVAGVVESTLEVASAQDAKGDKKAGADKEPTLAWRKAEGAEKYEAAKKLFEEKNYKEAGATFKDARKLAKGRVTKEQVNKWLLASEGGLRLASLQKQIDTNPRGVYALLEKFQRQYAETPIGADYEKALTQLRSRLFVSLETFDRPSKRYSEKFGKTFVKDPKFVKQGFRALKWETINHPSSLKVSSVPRNLTQFKAVSFWINFPKSGMPYWVVFKGKGKSSAGLAGTQLTDNTYSVQRKHKKGWHRVEIPFSDFTQFGNVSWDKIESFQIYFDQKRKITLYVDDICLVK